MSDHQGTDTVAHPLTGKRVRFVHAFGDVNVTLEGTVCHVSQTHSGPEYAELPIGDAVLTIEDAVAVAVDVGERLTQKFYRMLGHVQVLD